MKTKSIRFKTLIEQKPRKVSRFWEVYTLDDSGGEEVLAKYDTLTEAFPAARLVDLSFNEDRLHEWTCVYDYCGSETHDSPGRWADYDIKTNSIIFGGAWYGVKPMVVVDTLLEEDDFYAYVMGPAGDDCIFIKRERARIRKEAKREKELDELFNKPINFAEVTLTLPDGEKKKFKQKVGYYNKMETLRLVTYNMAKNFPAGTKISKFKHAPCVR